MKKLILVLLIVIIAMFSLQSFAVIDSCILNNPVQNQYDNGQIRLNATAVWSKAGNNVTNVTFTFVTGSTTTTLANGTVNGTRTNTTGQVGAGTVGTGDFTYTLSANDITENAYTEVYATCYNKTVFAAVDSLVSTAVTNYAEDTTNPAVAISAPLSGSTVVPNNNIVTFEYTPADTNLANCTLSLNNQLISRTTSDVASSNATKSSINRFTQNFNADNSSVRAAIRCIDLAGLATAGNVQNNFTFNVLLGATSPAVKALQQQQSGGGSDFIQSQGSGFSVANAAANLGLSQNHFEKYGFIYAISIVLIGVFAAKKFLFKK